MSIVISVILGIGISSYRTEGLAHFVLMAWGFGAEVTRDSVTKVVKDWKLP